MAGNATFPDLWTKNNVSSTGNATDDLLEDDHSEVALPLLYLYVIAPICTLLYSCIFIVGVIGNFLVCYCVGAYKDMRDNIFHIFLANLSIADLLVVAFCVPTAMVDVFSQEIWYLGEEMCRAVPFLEYSVTHLSALTILAISFERFLAIIYPLKAQYISSRNRSMVIILVIWIVAFLSSIPFALMPSYVFQEHGRTQKPEPFCIMQIDTPLKQTYVHTAVILFFTVPFFILVVMYAFICHHLIRDSYKALGVSSEISATNMKARKQVVYMLATVVAAFFLCLLPFRILTIVTMYAPKEFYADIGMPGWNTILNIARIMFYINSACNPIVLYFMSSKFRTKFQHVLCCRPLPVPNCHSMSRSGTFRYSVRTENSSSIRRPEYAMHHYTPSFYKRSPVSNGNGNLSVTLTPIEELPML